MSALRLLRVVYGDRWVVISTNMKGIQGQSLYREEGDFPIDKVKKWMDEGKRITDIQYGVGTWVVTANRPDGDADPVGSQRVVTTGDRFPEEEIKKSWEKNEKVLAVGYGNKTWAFVTEENRGPVVGQSLFASANFDEFKKDLQQAWDKNKAVIQLLHVNGTWYALTQQRDKTAAQAFIAAGDWPQDKIAEYMKNKKYITALAYEAKDENWAIIFSPLDGGMKLATTEEWPNEKLKEIKDLFCYGKRD